MIGVGEINIPCQANRHDQAGLRARGQAGLRDRHAQEDHPMQ